MITKEQKSFLYWCERYIDKAKDDLARELRRNGRVNAKRIADEVDKYEDYINSEYQYQADKIEAQFQEMRTFDARLLYRGIDMALRLSSDYVDRMQKILPDLFQNYLNNIEGAKLSPHPMTSYANDFIQEHSERLANWMQTEQQKQLEDLLDKAVREGWSVEQTAIEIQRSGIRETRWQARRVALTELLRADNVAAYEGMLQSPSAVAKKWIHTGAGEVPRENHLEMDGTVVGKEERFYLIGADGNEYYPLFPGDPDALPAGESVNCHCMIQAVVDEDIKMLPVERREEIRETVYREFEDKYPALKRYRDNIKMYNNELMQGEISKNEGKGKFSD